MSIWWLIPQYLLYGISEVFILVGLQEFFYDQVPVELKIFVISFIEKATSRKGQDSWFSDNLNRAHLDNFYWVVSGLRVFFHSFFTCTLQGLISKKIEVLYEKGILDNLCS
uniref:Uncharacterized protein n=1 Tax=Solanum lycopersicum TaxID=4081 RepID=K4D8P2_SOLLC